MAHFDRFSSALVASIVLFALMPAAVAEAGGFCQPDATHLCFEGDRFTASMTYQSTGGPADATAVQPQGGRPGFFLFADPTTAETWVGITEGCNINTFYWVFALGVSNQGWVLSVTDHLGGSTVTYSAPPGTVVPPIQDLTAFPCTSAGGPAKLETGSPSFTTMILGEGRFLVSARLRSFEGQAGKLTRNSGVFYFFSSSSRDVLVKVHYLPATQFFAVAASWFNADTIVRIEDRCTGAFREYTGPSQTTVEDLEAFAATEACGLFASGFESGNTLDWTSTFP